MINYAANYKMGQIDTANKLPQTSLHTFHNSLSTKREGVSREYYILLVQVIHTSQSQYYT